MTREDVQDLLAMVQATYPNYNPPSRTAAVNAWTMALEEYSKDEIAMAFKVYMQTNTSGFAPAPGQLIDKIHSITKPQELNEMEAWALVSKAIRNSAYNSVEEYAKLPPVVQKAVGLYYEQPYSKDKAGNTIPYEPVETIIPAIYGQIQDDGHGNLRTTGAQRTGCSMCGFGIHMEERPHRFDRLRERNPKEWEFYMYRCCTDPETGEKFGWGRVLDYIGVPWEDVPATQMVLDDFMGGME